MARTDGPNFIDVASSDVSDTGKGGQRLRCRRIERSIYTHPTMTSGSDDVRDRQTEEEKKEGALPS